MPARGKPQTPEAKVLKGVDDSYDAIMQKRRAKADEIHRKVTGKPLNPDEGWLSQLHDGMVAAGKRGTLSEENARKYRKELDLE